MDGIAPDSDGRELLSEEHLKDTSRRIKSIVPRGDGNQPSEDDIKALQLLFEEVFHTASRTTLNATHRVAAWNVICGLVEQCMVSDVEQIRCLIWDQHIWNRLFDLYLCQSHNARPKAAKQLLATLSSALQKTTQSTDFKIHVSSRLVTGIRSKNDQDHTKSCLQVLAFFLSRDVLSLNTVLDSLLEESSNGTTRTTDQAITRFLSMLFKRGGHRDYGSTIGQVISIVLDKSDECQLNERNSDTPVWLGPLETAMYSSDMQLEALRTQIMPILFKRSLSDYLLFLNRHGLQDLIEGSKFSQSWIVDKDHGSTGLFFDALVTGKDLGLLYETEDSAMSLSDNTIFLPLRCIEQLLYHSTRGARLAGLALLITSRSATRLFPPQTFKVLKRHLSVYFADTDANFRSEVCSLLQRFMDRCRAATAVLARQSNEDSVSRIALLSHESFLLWLLRFLAWELRPTASYQRHISALKALLVVAKSGVDNSIPIKFRSKSALNEAKWPFSVPTMHQGLRRQLLDLLMDPFDDVRQTSAATLSIYAASCSVPERERIFEELTEAIDRAESTMLSTGRADHADGVAHLYSLLIRVTDDTELTSGPARTPWQSVSAHLVDSLERMLDSATRSLAIAANKYPIHGLLTSIRYTMTQDEGSYHFENIPSRLVNCLDRVWEVVKPVLCNDAPEGYVPEDPEDVQDVTTKDALNYCWRALKESSLLIGVLVNSQLLDQDRVLGLVNLCFTQLAELRHRGAFSTVAQTWITCCIRCRDLHADGQSTLLGWYDRVLGSVQSNTTINTRRSAGLPSLICGFLIADKTERSTSRAILDLTAIARQPVDSADTQESSLRQVHALNCIKDIVKNTRLAEHSERFVAHAFLLAAESLQSRAWAIRNCGLMLFRAAIDRLLGTNESHLDDKAHSRRQLSLSKQPEILDAIFDLLRASSQDTTDDFGSGNEGVFPALQLLQRVQISQSKRRKAVAAVLNLTSSSSWHVRDKAACTYAALIDQDMILSELERLLSMSQLSLNSQHGALLCGKYLLARLDQSIGPTSTLDGYESATEPLDYLPKIFQKTSNTHFRSSCPLIRAAYVDMVLAYLRLSRKCDRSEQWKQHSVDCLNLIDCTQNLESSLNNPGVGPGEGQLRRKRGEMLAYQLLFGADIKHSDMLALILSLAKCDANAAISMFGELHHLSLSQACNSDVAISLLIIASSSILEKDFNTELKCEVQRLLLRIAEDRTFLIRSSTLLRMFLNACESASEPYSATFNHVYADQWLQLEAIRCDLYIVAVRSPSPDAIQAVATLITSFKHAIEQEYHALFSREAVTLALYRLEALWHYLNTDQPRLLLWLCFGVYDLLNDDDEDIRQIAAKIVSRILDVQKDSRNASNVCEPITASQRLVRFMLKRWPNEPSFAEEAVRRAFGFSEISQINSVKNRIATSSTTDTALFVEEKQNLYIDEAREVRLWTQVVNILPAKAIPRRLVRRLAEWTANGLDELRVAVETEADGPLGWTTKPDTFLLGLQVVYGAETLLRLVEKGIRLPVQPSSLRMKLGKFTQICDRWKFNQLWQAEIDGVVTWAVTSMLARQSLVLAGMLVEGKH